MLDPKYSRIAGALIVAVALTQGACSPGSNVYELSPDAIILAFGDSLTRGVGATPDSAYPSQLQALLGVRVVNSGVPGETTGRGLDRLQDALRTYQPALVILCHGGNDILRNRSGGTMQANLALMVEQIHATGAKVLMVAVPGRNLTLSAHPAYERVASDHGVRLEEDVLVKLLRSPSKKSDPIHLNAAGYRALAEGIARHIRIRPGNS